MPALLFAAFILVPIAELYVIIAVGQSIGVLPTLVLLVVDSLVGAYLVKREGVRAWRALRSALQERRLPAKEVADGTLVVFGGALLLTPGFLTDALGLLCILPPTRAILRRLVTATVAARLGVVGLAAGMAGEAANRRRRSPRPSEVIDGEVVDPDVPPFEGPGTARGPRP